VIGAILRHFRVPAGAPCPERAPPLPLTEAPARAGPMAALEGDAPADRSRGGRSAGGVHGEAGRHARDDRLAQSPLGRRGGPIRGGLGLGLEPLVCDPGEVLGRLRLLVPRPRVNLVLDHGVLGPRVAAAA
jgi:hypothetical protein